MSPRRILALCLTTLAAACGGEERLTIGGAIEADGEPRPLFVAESISKLEARERAYVMGHAFAIYLYSRTLPRYTEGTDYTYVPGVSSSNARVPYEYQAVVVKDAKLEGLELDPAERREIRYQMDDHCYITESGERRCPDDGNEPPQDPGSTSTEPTDPASGGDDGLDPPPDGDEEQDDPGDPEIDSDCESFLDPAAMEARTMAAHPVSDEVLAEGGQEAVDERAAFLRGVSDALAMEDFDEDTDYSEPEKLKRQVRRAGLCEHSPIVLDLAGDGIELGAPEAGVWFDLRQTGRELLTAWPRGDDALLVIDEDGDGAITHGGELFGTSLGAEGGRHRDGFASLARLDSNKNGRIDPKDARFAHLRLWRDEDRDGKSAPKELESLTEAGVVEIALEGVFSAARDRAGNRLALRSSFALRDHGRTVRRDAVDVWFRVRAPVLDGLALSYAQAR
jgi:hypothetical protein